MGLCGRRRPYPPEVADIEDLFEFISSSPSPYHAVHEAARRLQAAGFTELRAGDRWPSFGSHFVRDGGALVAWLSHGPRWSDSDDMSSGALDGSPEGHISPFRVVGAHTDSPNLRIKPRPDIASAGWRQLAVEVYGGVLLNSWLDRDLGLSGRVGLADGEQRLFRVDRPLLRIPQLAIHLDREISAQGLKLNPQQHLTPVWGVGPAADGEFVGFLADQVDVDPADVLAWDVMVHDLTPPAFIGLDDELVAAPRLDNLLSCWAAVDALVEVSRTDLPVRSTPVICLFDHEEVGSTSATGADGSFLNNVLERIDLSGGGDRERLLRRLAVSAVASADGAHATHPNYPERHDPAHPIAIDGGPVIKINANQRYATDSSTAALMVDACRRAGVPHQTFVSRNDQPCGSTIGPLSAARTGIATADIGVAQLSMHSARELCGVADPPRLARTLMHFLSA